MAWATHGVDEGSCGADEDMGMEHHVRMCTVVDEGMMAHETWPRVQARCR